MRTVSVREFTETHFQRALRGLLRNVPVKIWLVRSAGRRLDTIFSVGVAQPEPIKMFDRIDGLYLLGEGVPQTMVDRIHRLFERYACTHKGVPFVGSRPQITTHFSWFGLPEMLHHRKRDQMMMICPIRGKGEIEDKP